MNNLENELVCLFVNDDINSVDARSLWKSLGSKQQFGNWVTLRLDDYIEGVDFIVIIKNTQYNQIDTKDYILTLDTAKHIAMLERTEKGKEIRSYFIAREKAAKEYEQKEIEYKTERLELLEKRLATVEQYQKKKTKLNKVLLGIQTDLFGDKVAIYTDSPVQERDCTNVQIADHELRRRISQIEGLSKSVLEFQNKMINIMSDQTKVINNLLTEKIND
jgi:phage anti-repressor protein